MSKIKIGIVNIDSIYLRVNGNEILINDLSNDGVIECGIDSLSDAIKIIEQAYEEQATNYELYDNTIPLHFYQTKIGKKVFKSNFIRIAHIPDIIRMLKSVKIEKEKYILNKDSMLGLGINDLMNLNKSMRRRKKVYTDNDGNKYIEV